MELALVSEDEDLVLQILGRKGRLLHIGRVYLAGERAVVLGHLEHLAAGRHRLLIALLPGATAAGPGVGHDLAAGLGNVGEGRSQAHGEPRVAAAVRRYEGGEHDEFAVGAEAAGSIIAVDLGARDQFDVVCSARWERSSWWLIDKLLSEAAPRSLWGAQAVCSRNS